jgi:hypothetical protein
VVVDAAGVCDNSPVSSSVQVGKNESVFREVNEQFKQLQEGLSVPEHTTFVCECSRGSCRLPIQASLTEYQEVRADPRHFLVYHDHVDAEHERVVRSNDRFVVVEKVGLAGEIAEADAP